MGLPAAGRRRARGGGRADGARAAHRPGRRARARVAVALLIEALIEQGEVEAAERELRGAAGSATPSRPGWRSTTCSRRGACCASPRAGPGRGSTTTTVRWRDELWNGANPMASRWRSRASQRSPRWAGSRMAREDLERARHWGAASGIGVALPCPVALTEGGDASVGRLREAADVLAGSPARLEHARALTDLGAAMGARTAGGAGRAPGQARSRSALRRGRARRARARSCAPAGGRASDPRARERSSLTVSEQRVASSPPRGEN